MKKIVLLLSVFCFSLLFSQKEHNKYNEAYFPVKYLLKNSKDTIKTKILNIGIYDDQEFSPATYLKQITVLDPSGKKLKVNENNIQYMEITDLKKVKRKFISSKIISKDQGLLQIMYQGKKTAWYRRSYYSGPIYTYKTKDIDYLMFRNDKNITEIYFKMPGSKEQLKEKFRAYPDIIASIDMMFEDTDLLKILKLYDRK
jgi:hypothetical protein